MLKYTNKTLEDLKVIKTAHIPSDAFFMEVLDESSLLIEQKQLLQ